MHSFNTHSFGLWVLGLVLLIAMWKDMTQRRIPNALLVVASGLALLWSMTAGGVGLSAALAGGLAALLVFLVFHVIGAMGAGDVKLMATVGLFLGQADVLGLCISVLIAGGVQSLIWAIWTSRLREVLRSTWQSLSNSMFSLAGGAWPVTSEPTTVHGSMPYALAIGAGTFSHLLLKFW
ncbi:prepilin peptidase [Limnohabitans sp. Jir72]|uniref:A24 family peptidase n=1 Tax=Limnohabitans sp. Jir72 TaxID=1977909 RepID=UPI001304F0C5|nr:prepilin peptidase [Limnohabitans sp. Jir72]